MWVLMDRGELSCLASRYRPGMVSAIQDAVAGSGMALAGFYWCGVPVTVTLRSDGSRLVFSAMVSARDSQRQESATVSFECTADSTRDTVSGVFTSALVRQAGSALAEAVSVAGDVQSRSRVCELRVSGRVSRRGLWDCEVGRVLSPFGNPVPVSELAPVSHRLSSLVSRSSFRVSSRSSGALVSGFEGLTYFICVLCVSAVRAVGGVGRSV